MTGHAQPPKPARRLVRAAAAVAVAGALAALLLVTQAVWGSQTMSTDEVAYGVAYQVDLQVGAGSFQYDLPAGVSVTLPISVMVNGAQPLAAASVLIRYDPAVLQPIQCVARPGAPPGFCNTTFDPQNGLIRFNILSETGVTGAAGLFDLTFEVVSVAIPGDQSAVTPLIESLADPFGNYMTSRAFGSTITVVGGGNPQTMVYVGAPQQTQPFTVTEGLTTTVPIWVTDVTRLGSASFSLAFDPAVVRPLACHPLAASGNGDASGVCSVHSDHVRANLLSVAGLSGSVLAFEVIFTATDGAQLGASSSLDLTVETLADTGGAPIPACIRNRLIQVVAASSPDIPLLRLEPASQNLTGDARSTVHVFLDQAATLRAATWNIRYDSAVLLAESCQLTPDFADGFCNATGEPGVVRMNLLSADPPPASVDVATIVFRRHPESLADQLSSLTFEVTNFADLAGNRLPYRSQGAVITLRGGLGAPPGVTLQLGSSPSGGFHLARGASLDLPITFDIDPARPVGSLTGRLHYDPAVLRPTQCLYDETAGGANPPMGYCNAHYDWATGIIRFNLLSAEGVSGPLTPFTLTFEAASGATEGQSSSLNLTVEAASGPQGEPLTWRAYDTSVLLKPPVAAPRVLIGPPGSEDNGIYNVTLGYTRTVAVWVEGATDLGAATLYLSYDPNIIRAVKCNLRSDVVPQIAGGFCAPVPASGTVRTNVVMQQGFTGTGHFYDIVFAQAPNVVGGESTPLTLTVENFVSIAEVPIPTTVRGGQIDIDSGLNLDKTVAESEYAVAGDLLHYSYEVTNGSLVSLHGPVTIADDKVVVSCPDTTTMGNRDAYLDPGERIICTAIYTIKEEDVTARTVTNTATATADGVTSNPDRVTVYKPFPTSVTLGHFVVRVQDNQAIIEWETNEELNIAGFNVLRKVGDSEFAVVNSELLFAEYAGSNMGTAYSLTDTAVPDGALTYILQAVQLDGHVAVLGQVEILR